MAAGALRPRLLDAIAGKGPCTCAHDRRRSVALAMSDLVARETAHQPTRNQPHSTCLGLALDDSHDIHYTTISAYSRRSSRLGLVVRHRNGRR